MKTAFNLAKIPLDLIISVIKIIYDALTSKKDS